MRKKHCNRKHCQKAAIAAVIAAMTVLPVQEVLAAGPGEGNYSSQGPGSLSGPGGGPGSGNSADPGGNPAGAGNSAGPGNTAGPGGGPGSGNTISPGNTIGPGGNTGPGQTDTGGSSSDSGQTAANPNAWKRSGNHYLMPDGSPITNVFRRGIDVSRWQGEINWDQVAADDISFVMLGTRSRGEVDPYFHRNIQEASRAGIQVGVYIYSLATTPEMAVEEADFVLDLIKDYPVSYPVALDMEDDVQAALSSEERAAIANAFCQRISQAGYYPIIYANEYWLSHYLDMSRINYPVWVARYSQKPAYASPVMWQCTDSGAVSGIRGNVDIDFQFRDFSGVIPAHTWRTIAGKTYYYADYKMQKNNWIHDGDGWYYMDGDGLASKNWQMINGERYYLDESSGKMQYGWKMDEGTWYYLGSSGAAVKGWIDDNGTWYYGSRTTGAMETGWLEDQGRTYYLDSSGRMATGWIRPEGRWHYMNGNGAMVRGWAYDGKAWYHLDQNGVMETGWLSDNGRRYYLTETGAMAVGWRQIEGKWYWFDSTGSMTTGWQQPDGSWYYLKGDGSMAVGLVEVGGISYYLDPDSGRMASDTEVVIGDRTYRASGSGRLEEVLPEESQENGENPETIGRTEPAGP